MELGKSYKHDTNGKMYKLLYKIDGYYVFSTIFCGEPNRVNAPVTVKEDNESFLLKLVDMNEDLATAATKQKIRKLESTRDKLLATIREAQHDVIYLDDLIKCEQVILANA